MLPDDLPAHARTVAHLATYFDELKQAAVRLRERAGVRDRGFFSPSEDEVARQLLVSYWMARAALFEVAIGYRDVAEIPPALRPTRFLITFTTAILFVDRHQFEPIAVFATRREPRLLRGAEVDSVLRATLGGNVE